MPGPSAPRSRITYDRFGRAGTVAYRNPDGSEYGSLLQNPNAAHSHHHAHHHHSAHSHHQAPASQYARAHPSPPGFNRLSGEGIDPNDGMADNPLAQALFHSQVARNQWQGSYRLVRNATAAYSSLAFLAFFAPEILGGSSFALRLSLNQAGAFGPATNRLFWSGSGFIAASRYGGQLSGYVGNTLEETPIGEYAVWVQMYLKQSAVTGQAWSWLSTSFAEGAQGEVTYFAGQDASGAPMQGQFWLNK